MTSKTITSEREKSKINAGTNETTLAVIPAGQAQWSVNANTCRWALSALYLETDCNWIVC